MTTLPTGLSILVFVFFIFLVLPVLITIVFESRRCHLFVLLILSRFLASSFLKLKPFVPEFAEFHFSYFFPMTFRYLVGLNCLNSLSFRK